MAKCPRCGLSVAPFTRCDRCGLMLGFDGFTVLIDFEDSPAFERVRALAQRRPSCSEWEEENGRRYLRVTYSQAEKAEFDQLAVTAASLSRKHVFLTGMEIPWPTGAGALRSSEPRSHPPRAKSPHATRAK